MNIILKQLEISVDLHAVQPEFLNLELHYIIAERGNKFRFTDWNEMPKANEQKFYCFLQEKQLLIPAGNIVLKGSYVIMSEPIYPLITDCNDLIDVIETVNKDRPAKAIRQFSNEDLESIKRDLQKKFALVETHIVASPRLKHHILVADHHEISVSPTMVYLRMKAPFPERHYQDASHE
jgi:hypothetical protein